MYKLAGMWRFGLGEKDGDDICLVMCGDKLIPNHLDPRRAERKIELKILKRMGR